MLQEAQRKSNSRKNKTAKQQADKAPGTFEQQMRFSALPRERYDKHQAYFRTSPTNR